MIRRVLLIGLVAATISCTTVQVAEQPDVREKNDKLRAEYRWKDYKPKPLPSVGMCGEQVCMSEEDFRQSEQDKVNLVDLRKTDSQILQKHVTAHNKLVDALTIEEMAKHREREARQYCEIEQKQEKIINTAKSIGYGALCGYGILKLLIKAN